MLTTIYEVPQVIMSLMLSMVPTKYIYVVRSKGANYLRLIG
jgi:hypothetical protein